jgi:hypothetical protein
MPDGNVIQIRNLKAEYASESAPQVFHDDLRNNLAAAPFPIYYGDSYSGRVKFEWKSTQGWWCTFSFYIDVAGERLYAWSVQWLDAAADWCLAYADCYSPGNRPFDISGSPTGGTILSAVKEIYYGNVLPWEGTNLLATGRDYGAYLAMPSVFNDVRFLTPPTELWSGQPFHLEFYFHGSTGGSRWGIKNSEVNVSIKVGDRLVWGPSVRTVGVLPDGTVTGLIDGVGSAYPSADFSEIESFLGRIAYNETVSIPFKFILDFVMQDHTSWIQDYALHQEIDFVWSPVTTKVPVLKVYSAEYPSTVHREKAFTVHNSVDYPYLPQNVSYNHLYIKVFCVGEDGVLREFSLYNSEFGTNWPYFYPNDVPLDLSSPLNIEQITGPLTIPFRHYDITVAVGYTAMGKIVGTDINWQRADEVTFIWPVDVIVGSPAPNFLPAPPSIYPPYSVKTTDLLEVILGIENYGAPGTIYIDCGDKEVWRKNLTYLGTDQWSSGPVTIDYFLGPITQSGKYEIIFKCGYIDDSGNKVPVGSPLPLWIYVIAPTTPPGKVSLTISAGAGGTTSPAPGTYQYNQGATVTVTATPSSGYVFDHWEGTVSLPSPTKATISFALSANGSLTAVFASSTITPTPKEALPWYLIAGALCLGGTLAIIIGTSDRSKEWVKKV